MGSCGASGCSVEPPTAATRRPRAEPRCLWCVATARSLLRWRAMASPLLETKLYVPRPRRGLVARPRLSERLGRGAESKLTLISAPAGRQSAAWLSLDHGDNQPGLFWSYLITALQTVAPGVGASGLSSLQGPQ